MKKFFFALALMATIGLGGLAIETASAQNTNSSTTMERHDMGRRGRHHWRSRHRRHRMHRMTNKNSNM
jgi:hypothetical protein